MDIPRPTSSLLRAPSPIPTPSGAFQVFLRLRPSSEQSSVSPTRFISATPGVPHVFVTPPDRKGTRPIDKFSFTKVFDEDADQMEVFADTVFPMLQDCLKGQDAMLATLGVTGSGKVSSPSNTPPLLQR